MSFRSDAEAVTLANDCPFGLGSAVFSRDVARARRLGAQLEVGATLLRGVGVAWVWPVGSSAPGPAMEPGPQLHQTRVWICGRLCFPWPLV